MRPVQGVGVTQDFTVSPGGDIATSPKTTPIIINSFNRLTYIRRLVDSLRARDYENLYVIDNASTYEPLLDYYRDAQLKVFALDRNVGYLALWTTPVGAEFVGGHYVYTDSDIEPAPECPDDFIDRFREGLDLHPRTQKVGFGLKIDDLPGHYPLRERVIDHEKRFWTSPVSGGLYRAAIDTTFALYRPGAAGGSWLRSLRTGEPYVARHLPWYEDPEHPSDEELNYLATMKTSTHWSLRGGVSDAGFVEIPLEGQAIRVVPGPSDDAWNMASRGEWKPEAYDVIDAFADPAHSYMEIGSGPGQTAFYAARLARHVYAFEPDPERYAELSENVSLNARDIPNVTPALVRRRGASASEGGSVLQEFAASPEASDCGLVGIDAPGMEPEILRAMKAFLRRRRPTLLVTLWAGKRFRISTKTTPGKVAIALLGVLAAASVVFRLRFYRHLYNGQGDDLTFRRLIRAARTRSRITIVATDRAWPDVRPDTAP